MPVDLTATYGDILADVKLPEGFAWQDETTTSVGDAGKNDYTKYRDAHSETKNNIPHL